VSNSLLERLRDIGADPARLHVMRNGVDLETFQPMPKAVCRAELGIPNDALMLMAVGHLVELKGHRLMIEAL
jgi:glycosyltransferase involved in cell wall biosynthesis